MKNDWIINVVQRRMGMPISILNRLLPTNPVFREPTGRATAARHRLGGSSTYCDISTREPLQCRLPERPFTQVILSKDETVDLYEVWHTDPETFMNGLIERAESTVPHPMELENMKEPFMRDLQLRTDAYRSRLHLLHVCWLLFTFI